MGRYLLGLLVAVTIAFAAPYYEVKHYCEQPKSEQCVWGKALIWVNRGGTFAIVGLPAGALVAWFMGRRKDSA